MASVLQDCEGGTEAGRRPEAFERGTGTTTGRDALENTFASDLCFLRRVRAGARKQLSAVLSLSPWLCPQGFSVSLHVAAALFYRKVTDFLPCLGLADWLLGMELAHKSPGCKRGRALPSGALGWKVPS